ncbi:glycoside hydrolase family 28 protein, partial [Genlisea aurea]
LLDSIPRHLSFHRTALALIWALGFLTIIAWQRAAIDRLPPSQPRRIFPRLRSSVFDLTDFGAVGDGFTVNTRAFERAISEIRRKGGGQLNVESGRWLTAPFNLTSNMTLFLARNAVILGTDDASQWPLLPALPSYGYGREKPGPRYGSLIHGQNLSDVVITGHNGTINGQGETWWKRHLKNELNHTRGPLIELMWSRDIVVSDVTLLNSPFWTLHPYDCRNITVRNVTILAPLAGSPNTDGIDPDSCENVLIEDCYINVGDDGIAIKSGWDQYGIAYGRPSTGIVIRNVVVRSMISAGVSIGSEMSGGVSNVTVENLLVWKSKRGIRIKTSPGRGGYVRRLTCTNLTLDDVRVGIVVKTDYGDHPDDGYDPNALPAIEGINFRRIRGHGVRIPVRVYGSREIPVRDLTIGDMDVGITYKKKRIFQCSHVEGRVIGKVFPAPCDDLDVVDEDGNLVRKSSAIPRNGTAAVDTD